MEIKNAFERLTKIDSQDKSSETDIIKNVLAEYIDESIKCSDFYDLPTNDIL